MSKYTRKTPNDAKRLNWIAVNLFSIATLEASPPGTETVEIEWHIDPDGRGLLAHSGRSLEAAFRKAVDAAMRGAPLDPAG